jgi:hypothetical protein
MASLVNTTDAAGRVAKLLGDVIALPTSFAYELETYMHEHASWTFRLLDHLQSEKSIQAKQTSCIGKLKAVGLIAQSATTDAANAKRGKGKGKGKGPTARSGNRATWEELSPTIRHFASSDNTPVVVITADQLQEDAKGIALINANKLESLTFTSTGPLAVLVRAARHEVPPIYFPRTTEVAVYLKAPDYEQPLPRGFAGQPSVLLINIGTGDIVRLDTVADTTATYEDQVELLITAIAAKIPPWQEFSKSPLGGLKRILAEIHGDALLLRNALVIARHPKPEHIL